MVEVLPSSTPFEQEPMITEAIQVEPEQNDENLYNPFSENDGGEIVLPNPSPDPEPPRKQPPLITSIRPLRPVIVQRLFEDRQNRKRKSVTFAEKTERVPRDTVLSPDIDEPEEPNDDKSEEDDEICILDSNTPFPMPKRTPIVARRRLPPPPVAKTMDPFPLPGKNKPDNHLQELLNLRLKKPERICYGTSFYRQRPDSWGPAHIRAARALQKTASHSENRHNLVAEKIRIPPDQRLRSDISGFRLSTHKNQFDMDTDSDVMVLEDSFDGAMKSGKQIREKKEEHELEAALAGISLFPRRKIGGYKGKKLARIVEIERGLQHLVGEKTASVSQFDPEVVISRLDASREGDSDSEIEEVEQSQPYSLRKKVNRSSSFESSYRSLSRSPTKKKTKSTTKSVAPLYLWESFEKLDLIPEMFDVIGSSFKRKFSSMGNQNRKKLAQRLNDLLDELGIEQMVEERLKSSKFKVKKEFRKGPSLSLKKVGRKPKNRGPYLSAKRRRTQ